MISLPPTAVVRSQYVQMKFYRDFLLIFLLTCSTYADSAERVRVYAASSLTNVINEIAATFEAKSGIAVASVYGGSSSLSRQIEYGAPADIYISANSRWSEYLIGKQLAKRDNVTSITSNQLVVVSNQPLQSKLNPDDIESWRSALSGQRLAVGEPNSVPVGIYSKEALKSLGVWSDIYRSIAPVKNVRAALALAERGETPLAIVYLTDARLSDSVQIVASISPELHSPISYPAMLLSDNQQSRRFYQFLSSDTAKAIFLKHGFIEVD